MSRNVYYSDEEDAHLLKLWSNMTKDGEDEDVKPTDVAKCAADYGMCPDHTTKAIAEHIRRILRGEKEKNEEDDPEVAILKKDVRELKSELEAVYSATIGRATLYRKETGQKTLHFDLPRMLAFFWNAVPERMNKRIEELSTEESEDEDE